MLSRAIGEFNARAEELPGLALAWSPDGRYLAVPLFQPKIALGVIRADNGRVLKVIDDAYLPSWSPDGSRLAFVQGGDTETLGYIDHHFGPPRHLVDIGQASQPAVWARDGRSLAIVARRTVANRRAATSQQADLLRVFIEGGKLELITTLYNDPGGGHDRTYSGSSFSIDREGHALFHASDVDGMPSAITEFHPRTGETVDRFHPIDPSVRIGALAVSPNGKTLAFRIGAQGELSSPAFVDLETKQVTPLVPDESARAEWVATLIQTARALLRAHLPAVDANDRPVERPTLLPIPGELESTSEAAIRLRHLARIGRSLCDRPGPPSRRRRADLRARWPRHASSSTIFATTTPSALSALEPLESGATHGRAAASMARAPGPDLPRPQGERPGSSGRSSSSGRSRRGMVVGSRRPRSVRR